MAVTNINEETLPPQIDEEQAHDDSWTYRSLLELGYEGKDSKAKDQLTNILKYGSDTSHEKDISFRAMLDNRYQYTLNIVLGAIAEDPADALPESISSLRRKNAVEILNESYVSMLSNDPQGAFRIAYAITKKLDNPNKGTMKVMFMDSNTNRYLSNETYAVLDILENIINNVGHQSHEISVNVFDAIIRNLKYIEDSHTYCKEEEDIAKFFAQTIQAQDWKLYNTLVETFYNRMEELDINKPEDSRVLNNISSIYSQLLSNGREYVPSADRFKVKKKIFNKSLTIVKDYKDDYVREHFISPLSAAVIKGKDGRHKWENDPKLLKQQIAFHTRTLKVLIDLTNEQEVLMGDYLYDSTPRLHNTAHNLLARMLEEYVEGVRYEEEDWLTISEKYHPLYQEGLKTLLKGIEKGNKGISEKIIDQLNSFLSPTLLENPKHPFIKEGSEFYVKYYSNKLEKLKENEKGIIE